MKNIKILLLSLLCFVLASYPVSSLGNGVEIRDGAQLTVTPGAVLDMNCQNLLLQTGSQLTMQGGTGSITNIRDIQIDSGATISGSGEIALTGAWVNNGDYLLDPLLQIAFSTGCSVHNNCTGTGDTDGDGLSDFFEGVRDRNNDGLYDFLDITIQSYICDINNDNVLDVTDIILGLQVLSGLTPAGITIDADYNHDNQIGMAEVQCVISLQ